MSALVSEMDSAFADNPTLFARAEAAATRPNVLVRWAFYGSLFAIPFSQVYLPGTGGRIGVFRIVQLLLLCAIFSQPRVCLRFVPTALYWFLGYIVMRTLWGLWFTPEMAYRWWPSCRDFVELLPWTWVMFNILQFPDTRLGGLWALGLGCSLCAMFHLFGIGVTEVANGLDNRSSAFGLNANELGGAYATAIIALLGLWMPRPRTWLQRLVPFPSIGLITIAMAKTGSRTAVVIVAIGLLVLLLFGSSLGSWTKRLTGLVVIGVVLAAILWQIPTIMERFQEINPQNLGQHNPRARMAPVLWKMFLQSPIYGSGPDCYDWKLTREAMPYMLNEHIVMSAHNLALLLLVETGVIGFLLFAVGLAQALAAAWRARFKPCGPLPLALLLPFVVAGVTVADPSHSLVLWVALAYSLAGAGVKQGKMKDIQGPTSGGH